MNALEKYVAGKHRREITTALVRKLGVHPSTMWRWVNGKSKPGALARKAIASATKGAVTEASWEGGKR